MRIAVSIDDPNGLDSVVSPHFGRCPNYLLVDVQEREVLKTEAVASPFYGQHQPGEVPGFINSFDVNVMLTGGMGRRAIVFFEQFGIQPVTGASGTVRHALEQFLGGQLSAAEPCAVSQKHTEHEDIELPAPGEYEEDEAGRLREEVQLLQDQLGELTKRMDGLQDKKTE